LPPAFVPRWSAPPLATRPHAAAALSRRQLAALAAAAGREFIWGLRLVSGEVERWRSLAALIPERALREDAEAAILRKRANIDGAALFWTLPRARSPVLLRLLVAYEILADYLDCTSERGAHVGIVNGLHLHRALIDALNPASAPADYYRYHPWSDDGGYLTSLLETCREACVLLPSYEAVKPGVLHAARLTQVLGLNHEPDPERRDLALEEWAAAHFPAARGLSWWEWTGGASAWLTILALLAQGAERDCTTEQARAVHAAYLPWISLTGTMLDSYGDMAEDSAAGDHSYIGHYPSLTIASQRIGALIERSLQETQRLTNSHRHVVIFSCMVAMYLSKDSARTPQLRDTTRALAHAGGSLTRALLPVLRTWRHFYKQRST
jgi:tetraprenyl-beta-curcumene synthase